MRILEIAIPTFNREPQLLRLLRSILLQTSNEVYQHIDLKIYDNSDETSKEAIELLALLEKKGCTTTYIQNSQNIGGVLNIAQAYAKSTSAWTLVVGDDDYFMSSSLERILFYIKEAHTSNIGLVQFGFACIDDKSFIRFVHPRTPTENKLFSPSDAITTQGSVHDLSFLSALAIKSSVWSESTRLRNFSSVHLYAHVFCILDGLRNSNLNALRVDEHLVFAGYGRNEYYDSKVAVSRLSEFPAYDKIAMNLSKTSRLVKLKDYRSANYRQLRLNIAAALKIGIFRETYYRNHLHLIYAPQSPFMSSVISCKVVYALTSIKPIRSILKLLYNQRRPGKELYSVDDII